MIIANTDSTISYFRVLWFNASSVIIFNLPVSQFFLLLDVHGVASNLHRDCSSIALWRSRVICSINVSESPTNLCDPVHISRAPPELPDQFSS